MRTEGKVKEAKGEKRNKTDTTGLDEAGKDKKRMERRGKQREQWVSDPKGKHSGLRQNN